MPRAERCESEFLAAEGKLKRLQLCSAAAPVPRSISVRAFGKVAVTANRQIVSVEITDFEAITEFCAGMTAMGDWTRLSIGLAGTSPEPSRLTEPPLLSQNYQLGNVSRILLHRHL